MYYQYFGLEEAPFSIAVNPRYLFMSPRHRDALAHLLYGVGAGGGFTLLTGEVGTGKTTINRCLIEQLPDNADIAMVLNPALDSRDLLATVCDELGVGPKGDVPGLKELSDALHRFLLGNHRAGRKTVLMIDEAQHLGFEVLEQIRLLTNLETNHEKLLHIILLGQPELAQKLALPELRQLNQRITARFELAPLSRGETAAYVRHRLHVAGMPAGRELFAPSLLSAVHNESRGIPRLINLICDRMLLGAYGQNLVKLDRRLLRNAVREVTGATSRAPAWRRWWWAIPAVFLAGLLTAVVGLMRTPDNQDPILGPVPTPEKSLTTTASAESAVPLPTAGSEPADSSWRLSRLEGAQMLASLYALPAARVRADLCSSPLTPDLRCYAGSEASWDALLAAGRPALLSLVDERRFESRAVFLGIENDKALLATPGAIVLAPLDELSRQWSGDVVRLWSAPSDVRRVLELGDQGSDVATVARLFADLDDQATPLTENLFDASLQKRTRLFQRRQGLLDDGVMGEQTLRALVLAAGADLSMSSARAQLSGRLAEEAGKDER